MLSNPRKALVAGLVLICCTAPLTAQAITCNATSLTPIAVCYQAGTPRVNYIQSLPANLDVTSGFHLDSGGNTSDFNISYDYRRYYLRFQNHAVGMNWKGVFKRGAVGAHSVQAVFTSPNPLAVRLDYQRTTSAVGGTIDAKCHLSGIGEILPGTPPIPLVIGPQGFKVTLTVAGYTTAGLAFWDLFARDLMEITITPDTDSLVQTTQYGTACQATLATWGSFARTNTLIIDLDDPSCPPLAFFLFGDRRLALPHWGGCTIYNNAIAVVGVTLDPYGHLTFNLPIPPQPGMTCTVQGATLAGSTLHLTQGLELKIR